MLRFLKHVFTSQYLALVLRLYIGGLFIYAGMYKINYAAEFAETIASYQIIPYWGVNASAVVLPWIELICGILLVCGVRARSAAAIIGFLMIVFTLAIMINLMRDAPISCGCFSAVDEKISWWTVIRDLIWLIMTIHIFFYDKIFHLEERFSLTIKEV
ncbi:MAG: DoxX family membrane protein [Proteobacteria bacterium]|nr:DoxX family membrane protein [Desulfobacteraceae bacterium]MBU0733671.1 DoxX family membrane protein [Pseudomonadota bacterium]MBU1903740.1 DoxX family membrane protein [Pseudomonadota bacterium]